MALSKGNWDLAVFFINKGANVNIPNFSNAYPLHLAVQGNHVEMVRGLLARGAEMGTRANEYENNNNSTEVRMTQRYNIYLELFIKVKLRPDLFLLSNERGEDVNHSIPKRCRLMSNFK